MIARRPGTGDPLAPHSLSPGELKELMAAERTGEPFFVFRDEQARGGRGRRRPRGGAGSGGGGGGPALPPPGGGGGSA
jgi:hypothetical protein